MKTVIKNIIQENDNDNIREFFSEQQFVSFMRGISHENGDELEFPIPTYAAAIIYLNEYCDNFELLYSGFEG